MIRTPVVSSNLVSVGYDSDAKILEVEFKNNTVYRYFGVPENVYLELMRASSKGGYHYNYIKYVYPYERIV